MEKFKIAASAFWHLLKNPWLLRYAFDDQSYWQKRAGKKYGFDAGLPVLELIDFFQDSSETVAPFAFLGGGSMPTDLALIRALLRKYPTENYLEIGTWRGESVANAAPFVRNAYTVNLPDNTIRTLHNGEEYVRVLRQFSEKLPNVTHIQADSTSFDFKSLGVKFGLVFIDGDHSYNSVRTDTSHILDVLEPGGIIVWHDYTRHFDEIRWSVLNGILDGLPAEMHSGLYGISHSLCAIYLPRAFGMDVSERLNPYRQLQRFFSVTINVEPKDKGSENFNSK